MDTQTYAKLIMQIIRQQEAVIGPLAWSQAKKVGGLSIRNNEITVSGDGKEVLSDLVIRFQELFGPVSVEFCKDAVRKSALKIEDTDLPDILR